MGNRAVASEGKRGSGLIDFAVVGAQRAGTTHLNVCLADHPELYLSREEVPYFQDPFYGSSSATEVEKLLRRAKPDQLRGIHRPDYLGRPECPSRIRSDAPDARILIILRDPVRRAVSAYFWYVQFGLLPVLPLEEGMARLLDGQFPAEYSRATEVLEFGLYGQHVGRYLDIFGDDHVLVLFTEELGTPELPARTYKFLGVDRTHVPRRLGARTNVGAYDVRRLRFLRARRHFVFSWDTATTYTYRQRRLRRPLRWLLGASFLAVDRAILARVFTQPPPRPSDALEARLRKYYDGDIRVLETRLGRSFPQWRAPEVD